MANGVTFRMDFREFDRALKAYMGVTRHSLPDVCNKKAFFIARRAILETPKASAMNIKRQLGSIVRRNGQKRLNLAKASRRNQLSANLSPEMSLAEAIIRARLYRAGKKQPTGAEIGDLIESLLAARLRSIAFLKSGWLPAVKILAAVVQDRRGGPPGPAGVKQVGQAKGTAIPARHGLRVRALIENAASAKRDTKDALIKFGAPALQRAFEFEARSMLGEVARRQAEEARKIGIKVVLGTA